MIKQATDFLEESEALYELIKPINSSDFNQKSQFKGWTINEVLTHLHMWNWAADLSLHQTEEFETFIENFNNARANESIRSFENRWFKGLEGKALLQEWRNFYLEMSERFHSANPKKRVKWAGPDMSVLSSITARLMETWAHGQEIYDMLGVTRKDGDRIQNIVILGNNTFGWTFINRQLEVPETIPFLKLTAPSGAIWEFNEGSSSEFIEGDATEFCQVVTQVRNIKDTTLKVYGNTATKWMSIAQCFAGPPENPPLPGTRFRITG